MAIAYFIPDQAKLLRRHGDANTEQNYIPANITNSYDGNNNDNSSDSSSNNSNGASTSGRPQPATSSTATNLNGSGSDSSSGNNFRANIIMPRNQFTPRHVSSADVGCWELITQVFCYALRFYNESRSNTNSGSANRNSDSGPNLAVPLIHVTVEMNCVNSANENGTPTTETAAQQSSTDAQSTPRRKN